MEPYGLPSVKTLWCGGPLGLRLCMHWSTGLIYVLRTHLHLLGFVLVYLFPSVEHTFLWVVESLEVARWSSGWFQQHYPTQYQHFRPKQFHPDCLIVFVLARCPPPRQVCKCWRNDNELLRPIRVLMLTSSTSKCSNCVLITPACTSSTVWSQMIFQALLVLTCMAVSVNGKLPCMNGDLPWKLLWMPAKRANFQSDWYVHVPFVCGLEPLWHPASLRCIHCLTHIWLHRSWHPNLNTNTIALKQQSYYWLRVPAMQVIN